LKDTEAYKRSREGGADLGKALTEAFLKIDEVMKDKANAQELSELSGRRRFREDEGDNANGEHFMGNGRGGGRRGVNEAIRRALKDRLLAEGTPSEEVDLIIPSDDDEDDDDDDDGYYEENHQQPQREYGLDDRKENEHHHNNGENGTTNTDKETTTYAITTDNITTTASGDDDDSDKKTASNTTTTTTSPTTTAALANAEPLRSMTQTTITRTDENGVSTTTTSNASHTSNKKFVPLSAGELDEWEGPVAGAAAVSVALRNGEIICANAGDSRAVLCRAGKAIDLSRDHKPTDEDECERIVKAGGFVADGRVNGSLALSRAIGDFEYKRNNVPDNLPPEMYCVTANPELKTVQYEKDCDEFIIIACDGVWDVMTSQECVDFVRERLCYNDETFNTVGGGEISLPPDRLSKITEELCDACCATDTRGTGLGCDNISACVVQFLDSKKYAETQAKVFAKTMKIGESRPI